MYPSGLCLTSKTIRRGNRKTFLVVFPPFFSPLLLGQCSTLFPFFCNFIFRNFNKTFMQSTLKCAREKTKESQAHIHLPTHGKRILKTKRKFRIEEEKKSYVLIWKFLYADCVCSSLFDTIFFIIAFDGGI